MPKLKLNCVCGKSLDVMVVHGDDILAVARAQNWRVIGNFVGHELGALCPACNAATTAMKKIRHDDAQRD